MINIINIVIIQLQQTFKQPKTNQNHGITD